MIRPTKKLHYWDSCFFLAFLKNEKDKINYCTSVLKAAENGQVICHRRLLWCSQSRSPEAIKTIQGAGVEPA
ncbi:hypothetical protein [Microcystis sp. M061S2]|uniref:hypothetical protein n=1 Tax=Microcystis sp. M061S2 TaxID=2771171 RepID=UPI002585F4BC|nr:hypothetical protein [Microcystis sp. M061S2]